jgi:hypothetical protein
MTKKELLSIVQEIDRERRDIDNRRGRFAVRNYSNDSIQPMQLKEVQNATDRVLIMR